MFQPMIADNCDRQPKTVVIQPWPGIGDMIWHLPAIKALAANDPSGQVDLVTNKNVPVRALLGNEGTVCRYFLLALRTHAERKAARLAGERTTGIATLWQRIASVLNLTRALRSGRYRRAFVFHQSPRYVLAARLAGIPEVHAYGVGMQNIMLTRPALLSPDEQKLFTQDRARTMLDTLGIAHDGEPPRLHPDEHCVRLTAQLYANFAKPWVGIGIGSARANNIWPPERFAVVADALWQAGYRSLFLLGAAHETGLAQTISANCRVAKPIIVTDQPLDRAVGLLAQCAFSFSNDSGLMNASVALGVMAYGLSGAAAPNVFSPLLRPIIPEDGFDGNLGASRITVERALAKLREDGILDNNKTSNQSPSRTVP
jgi:heptosyltransferase II